MTGSSSWITKERRLAVYIRDGFVCQYCGRDLSTVKPEAMGLDHLEDLVDGGGHKGANHASTNIITVCRACNSSRQDRPWMEYAPGGAIERIQAQRVKAINLDIAKAIISGSNEWFDR